MKSDVISNAPVNDGVYTHTIDGRAESSEHHFDVVDPSRGTPFARCPDATRAQLDRAVAAARRASIGWRALDWPARGDYLTRFADALIAHAEELSRLLSREQGKPVADAHGEIVRTANAVKLICTKQVSSDILLDNENERIEQHYRPLGVAGVIAPWNVPVGLMLFNMTPPLYTGNTVIAKPSPYTPLTTLRIGELARDIFPPGVLNIVAGGDALGQWMTEHSGIDKISFTGSVATGKRVMASAAINVKRVTLELGGNDAAIVLDDVDPKSVAPRLFWAAFANNGQVCMAIKRLYVHENVYEAIVTELAELARSVKVGDGLEQGVRLGPLQNKMQYERFIKILDDTRSRPGVRFAAGGSVLDRPGYFVAPTIVADIEEGARLVDEEQFGPALPVMKFRDPSDAVRRANNTRYGLSASVWSADIQRATELASGIEAGTVWVNNHMAWDVDTPFGGWKESGLGRINGDIGLKSSMEAQVVRIAKRSA